MSDEPTFSPTLERLWRRLPRFVRDYDAGQDWTTKRMLAAATDRLADLETLLDRIDYVTVADGGAAGDTSELVDPAKANAGWLRWLAQLVSVEPGDRSTSALRAAIANAETGWLVGSQDAVIAAVQAYLTGTKSVTIQREYMGDVFRVLVTTLTAETPRMSLGDLDHYYGSLGAIDAAFPTLGDIPDATRGIRASLELQAPAHVQLDYDLV